MRQDHAILLCSLLLGWGMNAYVALGTIASKPAAAAAAGSSSDVADVEVVPHAWVVTADTALYFWEPLSGTRHEIKGPSRGLDHPFVDVHVLFRHDSLLVSAQQHTSLRAGAGVGGGAHGRPYVMPSFDLSDRARWLQVHDTCQHSLAVCHL